MLTFLQGKVKVYQSINQNKTYTTPYVAKKKRLLVGALEGFYAAKADWKLWSSVYGERY